MQFNNWLERALRLVDDSGSEESKGRSMFLARSRVIVAGLRRRQTARTPRKRREETIKAKPSEACRDVWHVSPQPSLWARARKGVREPMISLHVHIHILSRIGEKTRNYKSEIIEELLVSLTAFIQPLGSPGCYLAHPGLHPSIAWVLARCLDIQNGDVVLDPMCGRGVPSQAVDIAYII